MNKKENGKVDTSKKTDARTNCTKAQRLSNSALWSCLLGVRVGREGFNPATGSPTATLLRLHPSRRPHRGMRQ